MKIGQVKELVGNVLDNELKSPILLIGQTGIGKSQSMQQVAKEKNIQFIDLRLATQEVSDLIGIPHKIEKDGELRTSWSKPEWFPKEGTKGILALEEVNRAPEDVRQAIFELLTEWKLHTHELPKGWVIVSMINPDNGNYHVASLDNAFLRRFIQIVVEAPDEIDWGIWAKRNNVKDEVIRFSAQFPNIVTKKEKIDIEAKPTRAGLAMLSDLMDNNVIPKDCLFEVASGILGIECATTFINSLKHNLEKFVTAQEIMSDYKKVQETYLKHIKNKQSELIYMTMLDVISSDYNKLNKKEAKNYISYLKDSPEEVTVNLILKSKDLVNIICKYDEDSELASKIMKLKEDISKI